MLRSAAIRQLIWTFLVMSQQLIDVHIGFSSTLDFNKENKIILIDTKINESYLNSNYHKIDKFWFDPDSLNGDLYLFKGKLDYLNINYIKNKNYRIFTFENEINHFHEISLLSKDIFRKLGKSYFEKGKNKWLQAIYQFSFLNWIKAPIEVFGLVFAVYRGHLFRFRLSSEITLIAWTGISSKTAKVFLELPWFQGKIEYSGNFNKHQELSSLSSLDPSTRLDERYRFTLSKTLSSEHLVAKLTYLSTSSLLSVSVSKELLPHLNCLFVTFLPVNSVQSDIKRLGEVVQLDYGIEF